MRQKRRWQQEQAAGRGPRGKEETNKSLKLAGRGYSTLLQVVPTAEHAQQATRSGKKGERGENITYY
jgi:hypothetical protein